MGPAPKSWTPVREDSNACLEWSKLRQQAWLLSLKTGSMQERAHFQAILNDIYNAFIEEQQYFPFETIQGKNTIKDLSFWQGSGGRPQTLNPHKESASSSSVRPRLHSLAAHAIFFFIAMIH
jgi:hypothetical protein